MNDYEFDPSFTEALVLTFSCHCGAEVESESLSIPERDHRIEALQPDDGYSRSERVITCGGCGKQYRTVVKVRRDEGVLNVDGLPENADLEVKLAFEIPEELAAELKAILSDPPAYETFKRSINDIEDLNKHTIPAVSNLPDVPHPRLEPVFRRHLFVGVITCLETYLCRAFIRTVDNDCFARDKFMKYKKLKQSDKDSAKKAMLDIFYSRLDCVRKMYDAVLGVQVPELDDWKCRRNIRNDIVHRNGFDRKGKEVFVDRNAVENLAAAVAEFVEEIDKQLPER